MSLKQGILYDLELNRDKDISGQALAEKFGVSRNAVWKAINQLKNSGYEILSTTNRGYRLADSCDILSDAGIIAFIKQKNKGLKIFCYDSIDSTNEEAKRLLAGGLREDFLVCAKTQTVGKGRRGNRFFSPETGLYMTVVVHPISNFSDTVCITSAAAVAVAKAIENNTNLEPKIKWVNDIFVDGKKAAGILTEAVSGFEERVVTSVLVGIGLNVDPCEVPGDLEEKIAFLNPEKPIKNKLAAEITDSIIEYSQNLSDKSFFKDYKARSLVLNRFINFEKNGKVYSGFVTDIDNNGALKVKDDDGKTETLRSGKVSLKL